MVEIYSKILLYIPLNSYKEVLADYKNTYPNKDEDDFKTEYNLDELDFV